MTVRVRPYTKKRKDGTMVGGWEVDIAGRFPDGSEFRERVKAPAGSSAAAKRWAEDRLVHMLRSGPEQPKKESKTLEEFSETFLEHARANRQKASTIYAKESILDAHLKPLLGQKRLDEVGVADIEALKGKMAKRRPKTVNNALSVLSKLLKLGASYGYCQAPGKLGVLKVEQDEAHYYDFADYARLRAGAAKVGADAELVVLLGGDAGLREGEMLALERGDLDFERSQITVRRANWNGIIDLPKGNRIRRVPMTDALRAALKAHKHLRSKLVVCQPDGSPYTAKRLAMLVRQAEARAGMSETGLVHILRHTFCSHLAMRGATAKAIQELAGHVHLTTTTRYMHLSPAAKNEAIALLNARPEGISGGEITETQKAQ